MLDLTKKFSTEIQTKVANEQLVKIPGFPGNDTEFNIAFVTPKMAEIYKQREGKDLPDFVIVDRRFECIAECVGSQIKMIPESDVALFAWSKQSGQKIGKGSDNVRFNCRL